MNELLFTEETVQMRREVLRAFIVKVGCRPSRKGENKNQYMHRLFAELKMQRPEYESAYIAHVERLTKSEGNPIAYADAIHYAMAWFIQLVWKEKKKDF